LSLSNSVYPDAFQVEHEFEFDSELRELVLRAIVPSPSALPSVREYRYVKAKDEIAATSLPKREVKERYAAAVHQVALRTLHEVFEADREGRIETIALTVATDAIDPATGQVKRTNFVGVGADRSSFMS
jgi:restriction system protein